MDRQQPASSECWRSCVGTQRLDAERNLAPWKSCRNIPWTRWRSTSCQGKNGLRLVRASGRRTRAYFFSVAIFSIQLFRFGFRQLDLHPPPLMLLPLQYYLFQLYRFKDIGSNKIKMIFNPCPPSWSKFPMTLGTQEKHDILLMIKTTAKKLESYSFRKTSDKKLQPNMCNQKSRIYVSLQWKTLV